MAWNPVEQPWRISIVYQSGVIGMCGWMSRETTYATEAEARVVLNAPLGRGVIETQLHKAINPGAWLANGRWQFVDRHTRKKAKA